ncbi:MAG: hypothetical protein VYC40_05430 [Pseudomonadota bacterium]|nr:hypothetical protein [Pseudomonadota bacterium]
MKISKKDIEKLIKEEIEKLVVENVIKEGFSAYDAAAAPEVKEKLAEYGLDVGSYSDEDIASMLMEFIYGFGTRIVSVEGTIRMIDSRYSPEGAYKLNKPEDRPTPEKDMARSKKPLVTKLDRKPSSSDPYADDGDFEDRLYQRRMAKMNRRSGYPKRRR